MNRLVDILVTVSIWAQVNRYDAMGSKFRAHDGGVLADYGVWIVLALVLLAVILAVVMHRMKQREGTPFRNPRRLWADLCRLHQLDMSQRRLLKKLAQTQKLDNRAVVFVQPGYFRRDKLDPTLAANAAQVDALRKKLFD